MRMNLSIVIRWLIVRGTASFRVGWDRCGNFSPRVQEVLHLRTKKERIKRNEHVRRSGKEKLRDVLRWKCYNICTRETCGSNGMSL